MGQDRLEAGASVALGGMGLFCSRPNRPSMEQHRLLGTGYITLAQRRLALPSPSSVHIPPGTSLPPVSHSPSHQCGEHVASSSWPWDTLLPLHKIWLFTQSAWLGIHTAATFPCYREEVLGALPVALSQERQLDSHPCTLSLGLWVHSRLLHCVLSAP